MNNENKIQFDPGFAPLIMDVMGRVGYLYYTFMSANDLKLKKLKFPLMLPKIEKYLKTNVAFYLGCLMWACYISQFKDCELEGNKLLNEECEEKEYTNELDFLIDVVKTQLSRDSKYFLGKNYVADEKYLPILETYKEFLILNKGFCHCSNVNQIVLPENLKPKELNVLNEKIQIALENKNIDELLDYYDLVF